MSIWNEVAAERVRAHAKHGATSMESMPVDDPDGARRDIITEEIGEVAREFNEARHDRRSVDLAKLRKELIQVAAMTGAWADAIGALAVVPQPAEVCAECKKPMGSEPGCVWNGYRMVHPAVSVEARRAARVVPQPEPATEPRCPTCGGPHEHPDTGIGGACDKYFLGKARRRVREHIEAGGVPQEQAKE